MRPLLRCLLVTSLLLSVTAVAAAQAGRYIPIRPTRIPVRLPGEAPIFRPIPVLLPDRAPVLPPDFSPRLVPRDSGKEGEANRPSGAPDRSHVAHVPRDDTVGNLVCRLLVVGGLVVAIVSVAFAMRRPKVKSPNVEVEPVGDVIRPAWEVAPKAERTHRLMEFLAHRDRLFEPTALRLWAEQSFLRVQDCWQKGDYGPLGDLLLPKIRSEHECQLTVMRLNGERSVLAGLRVERLEFVHLDCPTDPNRHELTALITFHAASHYVDPWTGTFRRGAREPTPFQEFWVFRRQENAWHLAAIERGHASDRLTRPNRVEVLTEEQRQHAEECIAL